MVPLIPWITHRDPKWTIAQVAGMKLTLLTQSQKSFMQETSTFDSKSNASCMLLSPLTRVKNFHSWNFQCWLEVKSSMHETSTVTLRSKVSCMTLRRLTWIQKFHAWSFRSWLKSKVPCMKLSLLTRSQKFHAWNVHVGLEVKISMLATSSFKF